MLKVQILPGAPRVVQFINKNGQQASFVKQAALVTFPDGSAAGCDLLPPKGAQPYQPGAYTLDPSTSFYADRGELRFSPRLVPVTK